MMFPKTIPTTLRFWFLGLAILLGLGLALAMPVMASAHRIDPSAPNAATATTYHVAKSGDGTDGLSWTTAFTDPQDALALAVNGDEIWVATGVYTPGLSQSNSFNLSSGVQLYGGFAGTESQRTERDWETNVTVLSGDIGGDDLTDANGVVTDTANITGSNSYRVVWANGDNGDPITATTVLDGFTITAGQANGGGQKDFGGGFFCNSSSSGSKCNPSVSNVNFIGNSATDFGGAMYNTGSFGGDSSPSLTDVTFSGNSATEGGAMYNSSFSGGNSSPNLTNVTFSGNSATDGGAILNWGDSAGDSSPSLTDVIFIGNRAEYGGAMENVALGGASSPSLINVIFSGNYADYEGGALANYASNYASDDGTSSPSLVNVTFANNTTAGNGGVMYSYVGDTSGGTSSPSLRNTILWGNTAASGSQLYNERATPVISYTLIPSDSNAIVNNGGSVSYGPNILNSDPRFVNALGADGISGTPDDDLRLDDLSPAIDAGDNAALSSGTLPVSVTTDLDGNPRFYDDLHVADTGNGAPPIVDMGAYERQTNSLVHAPVAANDAYTTTEDSELIVAAPGVLGNDNDLDGDPLTALLDTDVTTGTLDLRASGAFTYTPAPEWNGVLTFTYHATDGISDSNTALVTITITAQNDAPLAEDDAYATDYELALTIAAPGVLANDTDLDGDSLTAALDSGPANGQLTLSSDGSFVYTPTAGFSGPDSFTYIASDGALTDTAHVSIDVGPALTYTLSISVVGNGSVIRTPDQPGYAKGTVVTLTATADTGSIFAGWSGAFGGMTNPVTLTITADTLVTATFSLEQIDYLIFLPIVVKEQ